MEDKRKLREDPKHSSFFTPYINTIPFNDCSDFPVNYTDKEIRLLEGSDRINAEIQIRRSLLQKEYQDIKKKIPEFKQYTF